MLIQFFSEDLFISDQNCVLFDLSFQLDILACCCKINSCILNHLPPEKFSAVFYDSLVIISNSDVDSQVQSFNEHCLLLLDKVAPIKTRLDPLINSP